MINSASFGITDPIFKLDIGYYVFNYLDKELKR